MKRSTILMVLAAMLVAVMAGIGSSPAAECDGGSPTNSQGSCESADNEVTCGEGTPTGLLIVSTSDNGAEVCNDGTQAAPAMGRIGAEGPGCDCVYADGDARNSNSTVQGWVRVDQNGVSCDVEGENSYNSGPGGPCM